MKFCHSYFPALSSESLGSPLYSGQITFCQACTTDWLIRVAIGAIISERGITSPVWERNATTVFNIDVISEINPLASSSSGHLAKRSALSEIIATARFLICSFASSTRSSLTSSGALFMALTNAATPSSTLEFCNEDCHAAASPFNIQAL